MLPVFDVAMCPCCCPFYWNYCVSKKIPRKIRPIKDLSIRIRETNGCPHSARENDRRLGLWMARLDVTVRASQGQKDMVAGFTDARPPQTMGQPPRRVGRRLRTTMRKNSNRNSRSAIREFRSTRNASTIHRTHNARERTSFAYPALPHTKHAPSIVPKLPSDSCVSSAIRSYFGLPEFRIGFRRAVTAWASVPE